MVRTTLLTASVDLKLTDVLSKLLLVEQRHTNDPDAALYTTVFRPGAHRDASGGGFNRETRACHWIVMRPNRDREEGTGRRGKQDATQYAFRYALPFSDLDASSSLPWWEPPSNPTRVLLNPTGSPLPMGSLVERFEV
jgi:hypothetical protein